MIREAIIELSGGNNLSFDTAYEVMDEIMSGKATDVQIAAYLTALAVKGETIDEIVASARCMREHAAPFSHSGEVMEIVGTGGDKSNSFNISTTSAIVLAASGVKMAKHGNRAASSKCGAADVLEALGAKIDLSPERSAEILERSGMSFLYAQKYHLAMKYVAPVRRELGIRTLFNILGPLSNPAAAEIQLMGVYDEALVKPMAEVLRRLGVEKGAVVYGTDRLDEVSASAPTKVLEWRGDEVAEYILTPEDYGFKRCLKSDLAGGTPAENAAITRSVLAGKSGAKRDAVVLNAALALHIAKGITVEQAIAEIVDVIDSGKAAAKLDEFVRLTNEA